MKILILNGPNLNLLGQREPHIYGHQSMEDYLEDLSKDFPDEEFVLFQSNIEGEIIDRIQSAQNAFDGIILNAAGYSHTSVAIADAMAASDIDIVEVHISNIHNREDYRARSFTGAKAKGVICGFGMKSYRLAAEYLINIR